MKKWIIQIAVTLTAILFLLPFLLILINSVKPLQEILTSPLSMPEEIVFHNYLKSWESLEIPRVMRNTLLLTVGSIAGIVALSSMSAYWVVRHPGRMTKVFSMMMVLSMLIPFAAIMLPLVRFMKVMELTNTFTGAILVYWGIGVALPFFMLQGSVKAIPYEIEEAAIIDGVGPFTLFWKIVFPLMRPAVVTFVVMDIFWIWNDFMIPLVMLNGQEFSTIQFAIKRLFGAYRGQWDLALPALVITVTPIIAAFILLQKKIVAGIAAGSVKT